MAAEQKIRMKKKKKKDSLWPLGIKHTNIHIIGVPGGEKRKGLRKNI